MRAPGGAGFLQSDRGERGSVAQGTGVEPEFLRARVRTVRVATYNIRHGRGMDDVVDVRRIAQSILRTGAAFIGLQELDRGVARSKREDQAAILEALTGLTVCFWPTLRVEGGDFGLGVAARGPFEARFQPLPDLGRDRPHGLVVVEWDGLSAVVTHLSRDEVTRSAELSFLEATVRELHPPVVVMGDFNQQRLDDLRAAGLQGDPRRIPTLDSRRPHLQPDHILVGPQAKVRRAWTIRTLASDHLPLIAEIELS